MTPGESSAELGAKTAMKTLGFVFAGLLLPVLVPAQAPTAPQPTTAEIERAQTVELDGLITRVNAATQAKDWPEAKALEEKLLAENAKLAAAYPDNPAFRVSEPEYYKLFGDAHLYSGEYQDAITAYEKSTGLAQALRDSGKDSPALVKTMGAALVSEGNAWLKLKNYKAGVACYERAVQFDPHPATAWFNICATRYNMGDTDGAVAAADKVIALDPTKSDVYFIKGSCLFANGTVDASGKFLVSAEAMATLRKYLELAPNGAHAGDVKEMLNATGVSVK